MTWHRQPLSSLVSRSDGDGVDRTEAKLFLRVDHTSEDDLIDALITSARVWVQSYTGRSLTNETYDLRYRDFPQWGKPLIVPHAPLSSVTSITYLDEDGVSQTWAATNYHARALSGPTAQRGWIEVSSETEYPTTSTEAEYPVIVRAVCGYGNAGAVPKGLKQAMLLLIGDMYEQRQETVLGGSSRIRTTVERLLGPYRLPEAS